MTGAQRPAEAALLFLNDVDPAMRDAYERWHAFHHVPQRLGVPGILWARRFICDAPDPDVRRYLTIYGLADITVLESRAYRRLVDAPDKETLAMRPAIWNALRLPLILDHPVVPPVDDVAVLFVAPSASTATLMLGKIAASTTAHPLAAAPVSISAVAVVCAALVEGRTIPLYRPCQPPCR